jgi:hypothetical protein
MSQLFSIQVTTLQSPPQKREISVITVSYKSIEGGLDLIKQQGTFTIEASLPFLGTYVPVRALNLLETCCISTSRCP